VRIQDSLLQMRVFPGDDFSSRGRLNDRSTIDHHHGSQNRFSSRNRLACLTDADDQQRGSSSFACCAKCGAQLARSRDDSLCA